MNTTQDAVQEGVPVRAPAPSFVASLADSPRLCFDPALAGERARGALLGAALGDAAGCHVEGVIESGGVPIASLLVDRPPTGWTDATDFTVLVMRALGAYFDSATEDPAGDFAARAAEWRRVGFDGHGGAAGICRTSAGATVRAMACAG